MPRQTSPATAGRVETGTQLVFVAMAGPSPMPTTESAGKRPKLGTTRSTPAATWWAVRRRQSTMRTTPPACCKTCPTPTRPTRTPTTPAKTSCVPVSRPHLESWVATTITEAWASGPTDSPRRTRKPCSSGRVSNLFIALVSKCAPLTLTSTGTRSCLSAGQRRTIRYSLDLSLLRVM